MNFSQLKSGDNIYILEIVGTFSKHVNYTIGKVISVSLPYDEILPMQQFSTTTPLRRKLVDLVISCNGEEKKLSVAEEKTVTTDTTLGLTVSTDKRELKDTINNAYESCKLKRSAIEVYDREIQNYEQILKSFEDDLHIEQNSTESFDEIGSLKHEISVLKEMVLNNHNQNIIENNESN